MIIIVLSRLDEGRVVDIAANNCVQILRADLVDRMSSRGVIASIQPQFVPTDCRWLSTLLPSESATYAYVWKTLIDKGTVLF